VEPEDFLRLRLGFGLKAQPSAVRQNPRAYSKFERIGQGFAIGDPAGIPDLPPIETMSGTLRLTYSIGECFRELVLPADTVIGLSFSPFGDDEVRFRKEDFKGALFTEEDRSFVFE
jgi:hypothetical protein